MTEWNDVPVFGTPPTEDRPTVRPSAYALLVDGEGRLAVVETPRGIFLPGGGMDPGETPRDAIMREVREECGIVVRIGDWNIRAVEFVDSDEEMTFFEKRSTFVDAYDAGARVLAVEPDHVLRWLTLADAIAGLGPPSHRWAVERFKGRDASADRAY